MDLYLCGWFFLVFVDMRQTFRSNHWSYVIFPILNALGKLVFPKLCTPSKYSKYSIINMIADSMDESVHCDANYGEMQGFVLTIEEEFSIYAVTKSNSGT